MTEDEKNVLLATLCRGARACSRFMRFLNEQPINDLTNRWYTDTSMVRSEIWDTFDFVMTEPNPL